jgi:hypothetical protein
VGDGIYTVLRRGELEVESTFGQGKMGGGGGRAKWAGGEVANMNKLMANWRANKIKNSVIIIPG